MLGRLLGRVPIWYLALVAGAGGLRVLELSHSARNERAAGTSRQAPAGRYMPMVVVNVLLFVAPLVEVGVRGSRPRPRWAWIGVAAAATGLRWWSVASLGGAWNTRGAVAPDLRVATRGPYGLIRHPNYVAVALEFLALPLIADAWISSLVLSALDAGVLFDRIREEERRLDALPAYREAFATRRRFIPGIL